MRSFARQRSRTQRARVRGARPAAARRRARRRPPPRSRAPRPDRGAGCPRSARAGRRRRPGRRAGRSPSSAAAPRRASGGRAGCGSGTPSRPPTRTRAAAARGARAGRAARRRSRPASRSAGQRAQRGLARVPAVERRLEGGRDPVGGRGGLAVLADDEEPAVAASVTCRREAHRPELTAARPPRRAGLEGRRPRTPSRAALRPREGGRYEPGVPGLSLTVHAAIAEIPAAEWDALLAHEPDLASPFVRHAFLAAAEESGCATDRTGWAPRHLALRRGGAPGRRGAGVRADRLGRRLLAATTTSRRRRRARGRPLLPEARPRRAVHARDRPPAPRRGRRGPRRALRGARRGGARPRRARRGWAHSRSPSRRADEARTLEALGLAVRVDFQYHWRNEGYRTMDEFLARFPSKRRNAIKRERAAPATPGDRDPDGARRRALARPRGVGAGLLRAPPRLDRQDGVGDALGEPPLLRARPGRACPTRSRSWRRGARGGSWRWRSTSPRATRLYGRYWGAVEDHPFLHFNVALYHSIDECIRRGVQVFEGGAGRRAQALARLRARRDPRARILLSDRRLDAAVRRHLAVGARRARRRGARWREEHPRLGG